MASESFWVHPSDLKCSTPARSVDTDPWPLPRPASMWALFIPLSGIKRVHVAPARRC
jgi:hypothetical protein